MRRTNSEKTQCTLVFENTRSGLSKTHNEENNNKLVRHAKVHSSASLQINKVKPRTYSSHVLGSSFISLDKLPVQMPLRYSNNNQVFVLRWYWVSQLPELKYMLWLCFKTAGCFYNKYERSVHTSKSSNVYSLFLCSVLSLSELEQEANQIGMAFKF